MRTTLIFCPRASGCLLLMRQVSPCTRAQPSLPSKSSSTSPLLPINSSLPLTTGEYLEWGDPHEKAAYDYMRSYSPYDNVGRHDYPTMLVLSSYNDSQVMYWEPAKWVAKLRALRTDDNLMLFKIKMKPGGHGGASGRYDRLHDTAFEYAFLLTQLGIEK